YGLDMSTQKMYINSTSHCLIFYQCIVGELYTIISEGKFTQSFGKKDIVKTGKTRYDRTIRLNSTVMSVMRL
ncbi:MAG: hypothetical protein PHC41_15980, partial [Lachnospiraceae bacterium]|nr:hypothetical protein [Lachnospiraceae bacterium]MDD3617688.1 hypothetical protein [Lachnospiraceae bacterium]